jgi:hypothetical protein
MAAGRARRWDRLTAIAGLVFVVALCLHWWRSNDDNWTGISNLGMEGYLMFIGGLFVIATPFVATMRQTAGRIQSYRTLVLVIGVLLLAWTIFRMADPPEFDSFADLPVTLDPGAWIALGAAIVVVISDVLALRANVAARPARSTADSRRAAA